MSRFISVVFVILLLGSCGGGGGPAPRALDDACAVLRERPDFRRALNKTERRWGVPVHVQMATIYQESKFDGEARTPFRYVLGVIPMGRQSSAYGYSQALDGTWDEYQADTNRFSARRNDIDDATDFIGWYMAESNEKLGIPVNDARNQYLAYHEGRTGYARGSYHNKSWLVRVSGEVAARADLYRAQLQSCRGQQGYT